MPRKALISSTIILEVLKKFEIFDENHKLKCRSDKVWKDACALMPDKLLPDTLNFYVRNNRWDLEINLKKHFNIPFEKIVIDSINITNESDVSEEFQPFDIAENVNNKLPKLYFDLILSDEQ